VGALRKPDESAYRRFATYEIVDPGTWAVTKGADWIEFVHEVKDTAGYAYVYRKRVRLAKDSLVLEHRLKNTGRKAIATSVYNHDFFMLDHQPTGPNIVVRFPFVPRATSDLKHLAEIRGRDIFYLKEFERSQTLLTEIEGFGATAADFDFRVENRKTAPAFAKGRSADVENRVLVGRNHRVPRSVRRSSHRAWKETSWRIAYEFLSGEGRMTFGNYLGGFSSTPFDERRVVTHRKAAPLFAR
jgi:hypothetical protein